MTLDEREAEKVEAALIRARTLAGSAGQLGDFAGDPVPTDEEWESLAEQVEEALEPFCRPAPSTEGGE